jgi:uncharacterized protein (UPF0305 family)
MVLGKIADACSQKDIHTLEMVQRRGARYVCNRQGNRSSVDSMLDTLKWKSLQHRRRDARLHMLCKTHHEDVAMVLGKIADACFWWFFLVV